jgi:tetratricopeptide (TPR) repeat protein
MSYFEDGGQPEQKVVQSQEYLNNSQEARERGHFADAFHYSDRAFFAFQKDDDYAKVSEAQAAEGLIWRHLYEQENESAKKITFGIRAKSCQRNALEILQQHNISEQYKALYELGKIHQTLGEDDDAIQNYQAAIANFEQFPDQYPYPESVMSEMKTRLYALEFKRGDQQAFSKYEMAVEELKQAENPDEYTKKVWVSGAFMHMAEALMGQDNARAKEFINEAKGTIGTDEKYILRRGQIEALESRIG